MNNYKASANASENYPEHLNPFNDEYNSETATKTLTLKSKKRKSGLSSSLKEFRRTITMSFRRKKKNQSPPISPSSIRKPENIPVVSGTMKRQTLSTSEVPQTPKFAYPRSRFSERLTKEQLNSSDTVSICSRSSVNPFEDEGIRPPNKSVLSGRKKRAPPPPILGQRQNKSLSTSSSLNGSTESGLNNSYRDHNINSPLQNSNENLITTLHNLTAELKKLTDQETTAEVHEHPVTPDNIKIIVTDTETPEDQSEEIKKIDDQTSKQNEEQPKEGEAVTIPVSYTDIVENESQKSEPKSKDERPEEKAEEENNSSDEQSNISEHRYIAALAPVVPSETKEIPEKKNDEIDEGSMCTSTNTETTEINSVVVVYNGAMFAIAENCDDLSDDDLSEYNEPYLSFENPIYCADQNMNDTELSKETNATLDVSLDKHDDNLTTSSNDDACENRPVPKLRKNKLTKNVLLGKTSADDEDLN